jgi:DNA-binding CsgD family transcriptional regulator
MENTDHLTDKQRRYVERLASGLPSRDAARAAGYSDSYAMVAAHRLKKKPSVAKALEAIRDEGRKLAVYDLARAMEEAQEVIDFAKKNKNAMAYFKAVQHRADLSGLLIDRVEAVVVDLRGSLEAAKTRVLNAIDFTPLSSDGVLAGSVRWAPRIPGALVAENPEAGPVEGESVRQVNNVGPENR